jgi:hypothetical protein
LNCSEGKGPGRITRCPTIGEGGVYIYFHDGKLKNTFLLLNRPPVNIKKVVIAADAHRVMI